MRSAVCCLSSPAIVMMLAAVCTANAQVLANYPFCPVLPPGAGPPTADAVVSPTPGGDDTARIQRAIDRSTGIVHFRPGTYRLHGPLHLRSNRTYMGEGSFDSRVGSVLVQYSHGAPIFCLEGLITSVTIAGLTFDGAPGAEAKGIAAGNPGAVLALSTVRDNFFLTTLTDCIDTPMQSTRIERNQFGVNGGFIGPTHRHIRSVSTGAGLDTNANWIVGNQFRQAVGSESVLFNHGAKAHLVGNNFEANTAETTLRIYGMFQVIIEGNYFEQNAGDAQMTFGYALNGLGDCIVRLENNYYHMGGAPGRNAPNRYVFQVERSGPHQSFPTQTQVFIGYEAGTFFSGSAELTTDDAFSDCYVFTSSPANAFHFVGHQPSQISGNSKCQ